MSLDADDVPYPDAETLRRVAVEDAILLLEQVRTGTDFEQECWQAAERLKQVFQ